MSTKSIDVIVPIYNEQGNIAELVRRTTATLNSISDIRWRLILIENGSTDESHRIISSEAALEPRLTELRLLRNFGMEGAIFAGLSISDADASVIMQGDLEDPPELITSFVREWRLGNDLVYGEIKSRESISMFRRFLTGVFYAIAEFLTDGAIRKNASDFRLITRPVRNFLMTLQDQGPFLRSLVTWPSNRIAAVPYRRTVRFAGNSKFRTIRTIFWSLSAILTLSTKPLRFMTLLGSLTFLGSLIGLVIVAIRAFFWSVPFPGFGTLIGLQFLSFGLLMLAIGIVSEYINRILLEVRPRPRFIVLDSMESKDNC